MSFDLKSRSKGSPLAVGDDFPLFLALCGGQLLTLLLAVLLLWQLIGTAHAETFTDRAFGRWERVTPETMLRPVPDWMPTGTPGAVTNEYRRTALQDRPGNPGGPNVSPRTSAPEQAAALNSSLERR